MEQEGGDPVDDKRTRAHLQRQQRRRLNAKLLVRPRPYNLGEKVLVHEGVRCGGCVVRARLGGADLAPTQVGREGRGHSFHSSLQVRISQQLGEKGTDGRRAQLARAPQGEKERRSKVNMSKRASRLIDCDRGSGREAG
eukprot:6184408-Pleurochrysis_carterae.AAC.2